MDKYVETLDALMKVKKKRKRKSLQLRKKKLFAAHGLALWRIQVWSVAPNSFCMKDLLSVEQNLSMPI